VTGPIWGMFTPEKLRGRSETSRFRAALFLAWERDADPLRIFVDDLPPETPP
jgi:hypothetical protein